MKPSTYDMRCVDSIYAKASSDDLDVWSLTGICSQETVGLRKTFKKDASIFCTSPLSNTPGLNFVIGSALKKSRCFAVTMLLGTRSMWLASSISYLDCANRIVLEPRDLPTRVWPIHVMKCCLMFGSILARTSSRNQATKDFNVKGQYSKVVVVVQCLSDFALLPSFELATWHVHLFICPLHKLVSVVGSWSTISNEAVAIFTCKLIHGQLLFKFGG